MKHEVRVPGSIAVLKLLSPRHALPSLGFSCPVCPEQAFIRFCGSEPCEDLEQVGSGPGWGQS